MLSPLFQRGQGHKKKKKRKKRETSRRKFKASFAATDAYYIHSALPHTLVFFGAACRMAGHERL